MQQGLMNLVWYLVLYHAFSIRFISKSMQNLAKPYESCAWIMYITHAIHKQINTKTLQMHMIFCEFACEVDDQINASLADPHEFYAFPYKSNANARESSCGRKLQIHMRRMHFRITTHSRTLQAWAAEPYKFVWSKSMQIIETEEFIGESVDFIMHMNS